MKYYLLTLASLLLGFGAWLCFSVWPPDALGGRTIHLATFVTEEGDSITLLQLWNGDGYLTKLSHETPNSARWDVVVDPDAKKSWSGQLLQTTNKSVLLVKLWSEKFYYNWTTKRFVGRNGKIKHALLIKTFLGNQSVEKQSQGSNFNGETSRWDRVSP